MGCTYATWVTWSKRRARSYLKYQVILDFGQQCRLIESHRTHVGPSALSFSRRGASIWVIKSKIPYFSYDREKTADSQIRVLCSTIP